MPTYSPPPGNSISVGIDLSTAYSPFAFNNIYLYITDGSVWFVGQTDAAAASHSTTESIEFNKAQADAASPSDASSNTVDWPTSVVEVAYPIVTQTSPMTSSYGYTPPYGNAIIAVIDQSGTYAAPDHTALDFWITLAGTTWDVTHITGAAAIVASDWEFQIGNTVEEPAAAGDTPGGTSFTALDAASPGTASDSSTGLPFRTADGTAPGTGTTAHTVQADFVAANAAVAAAGEALSGTGTQSFPHPESAAATATQNGTGVMTSGATDPATAAAAQTTVTTLSMSESEPTPALAEQVAQRTANDAAAEPLTATADAGATGQVSDYVVEEGTAQGTGLAGNGLSVEITEAGYVLDFLSAFVREFYQRAKRVTNVLRTAAVTVVARKDPSRNSDVI